MKNTINYHFKDVSPEALKNALIEVFDNAATIQQLKDLSFDSVVTFSTTLHFSDQVNGHISNSAINTVIYPVTLLYNFLSIIEKLNYDNHEKCRCYRCGSNH